jgi:hypothetical protein
MGSMAEEESVRVIQIAVSACFLFKKMSLRPTRPSST